MIKPETSQMTDIVERVKSWPATVRVTLARRILETIETLPILEATKRPRGPSAAEVATMFKSDKPAPSDEECQQILEEELIRKYAP